jgi:TonB-dependent receptor
LAESFSSSVITPPRLALAALRAPRPNRFPIMQTSSYSWYRFGLMTVRLFAFLLLGALASSPATAQTAPTGTVQGHVFNPATKEYVRDAEVRLEGTSQVTYTANDGFFQFLNVPAGQAKITVVFTGYNTATESVNVTAGQPAVSEISLTSTAAAPAAVAKDGGIVKLEAFSVSSAREGNSKAVMAQRRDMNIITSVSSDAFGSVTDGNVGEFLKYLPGIDLDYVESEPRGPRMGGMDGQYVGVSFDGMRTANADANRGSGSASRATSFEGFAITSVDSIEINRTASPENDADSPAGVVNMKTKRAFDRKGRVFNYDYGLNFNGEEFTLKPTPGIQDGAGKYKDYKWAPNWQLGYAESFFNQKFGVLLSASHANSYTEQAQVTADYNRAPTATDTRPLVLRDVNYKDGPKFIIKDALLLTADWRATPRLTLSLNLSYSYFEGHFQNRNFDFQVANNNANVVNGRSTVLGDGVLSIGAPRDLSVATGTIVNGVVVNNGFSNLQLAGGGASKLTYARQFAPRFEYKAGPWIVDGYIARSYARNNYEALERGFSSNEGGYVASGFTVTRPNVESWEFTVRQTSGADWFDLRSFTNNSGLTPTQATSGNAVGGTRVTNDNRTWVTGKWTGGLNVTWAVPFMEKFPTKMKFGGKWDQEIRNNHQDSEQNTFAYIGPGGNTVALNPTTGTLTTTSFGNWANVGPQYISQFPFDLGTTNAMAGGGVYNIAGKLGMPPRASRFETANLDHAHPELFADMTSPENYYTDHYVNAVYNTQTVPAGYWQSDVRLSNKLQIRFGVRVEQTKNDGLEFDPLTRNELLALGVPLNAPATNSGRPLTIAGMKTMFETHPKVHRVKEYTDWFPSFVAKYQIRPNLEWQAGVNKGIARPAIGDITGLWTLNDNASPPTVTAANSDLLPEYHKVYQTRLAYYFGGRSPGQISLALIQDEAKNFVVTRNYTAQEFGVADPDFAGLCSSSRRRTR